MDKSTLLPLKKISQILNFYIWFFYVSIDITIWIIFVCLKYIGLDLDLKQSLKKKTPTNIGELQHMKYICDKIILDTECEKLHTYFKTRVVCGIFWFVVNTIDNIN